mgnify:FL=1
MTKQYSRQPKTEKSVKARSDDNRAHFKNTYNAARVLKGMNVKQAQRYLEDVLDHKRCVPIKRFNSHVARTGQATEFGVTQGRWPEKSVKILQNLLQNMEANAKAKQLEADKLIIQHVQVNRAQRGRRRTYRAHGRITPFMSSPCHVELFAEIPALGIKKEAEKSTVVKSLKAQAKSRVRRFLAVGGDSK